MGRYALEVAVSAARVHCSQAPLAWVHCSRALQELKSSALVPPRCPLSFYYPRNDSRKYSSRSVLELYYSSSFRLLTCTSAHTYYNHCRPHRMKSAYSVCTSPLTILIRTLHTTRGECIPSMPFWFGNQTGQCILGMHSHLVVLWLRTKIRWLLVRSIHTPLWSSHPLFAIRVFSVWSGTYARVTCISEIIRLIGKC